MRTLGRPSKYPKYCKDCGGKKGNYRSIRCIKCVSSHVKGENNPNWKGNNVKFHGLHRWVERNKGKPDVCRYCKNPGWLDLANISQKYKRDLNDWEWLCRKCHMMKDGRLGKLIERNQLQNSKRKPINTTV